MQENEGFLGFVTDDDYNIRFAIRFTQDGGNEILKKIDNGSFEYWMKIGLDDTLTTSPLGFDKTGNVLYMPDSRGHDTGALTRREESSGCSLHIRAKGVADPG